MDALLHDLRFGIRQLVRQPGSSIVAVLTLALGLGVSTALLSVIDATMLRPLPYPHPEQLVTVEMELVQSDGQTYRPTASMEDLRAWQAAGDVFAAVAGMGGAFRGRIVDGAAPERIEVDHFTEDYLSMHGVRPVLGRGFTREETGEGAPLVAMLGHAHWQSRYGGREDVIGQTIRLDADVATIVGVLPAWFNATTPIATPLQVPAKEFSWRGTGRVEVYGRLRPGLTIEQARERLSARIGGLTPPGAGVREVRPIVTSRLESLTSRNRTTIGVLAGAAALILIIAAVNVAGLLLGRGAARQAELAARASLGAGRARLIRQLLTESAVLAVPACALGVLLAWLSLDVLVATLPLSLPPNAPVSLNLTVLALTAALLVPATLLFGLAPALRLSRVRIASLLARGSRQVGSPLSRRGGQLLIAAEVALAVVLVAGAGLMIRSLIRLSAVDLGFNPDGLLTMEVLPLERSAGAHREYYRALLERLRTVPGIASVGLVDQFALTNGYAMTSVTVAGKQTGITTAEVMPGYFEAIGAALLDGRFPTDTDHMPGFRRVVINEFAARTLFPGGSAVGRDFVSAGGRQPWTVIGVIADLRHGGPLGRRSVGWPQVFFPLAPDEYDLNTAMTVVVRPSGDVPGLGDRLREAANAVGPRVLVERIRGADEWFGDTVITPRRRTVLLGLLGGLGLVLALVGVFGMTAYAVARRTAEIGVRMAFGARPGQVVRAILRDAAAPIAAGTLLGAGAAALASRVIESFLFETAPGDPVTLAAVAATLATTGCLAALVPALRAARVDPASSLRAE